MSPRIPLSERYRLYREQNPAPVRTVAEVAETPWPDGIFARYQTVVGATVDLRWHNADDGYAFADCTGCGKHFSWGHDRLTREKAQSHAEACRALPKPGGES